MFLITPGVFPIPKLNVASSSLVSRSSETRRNSRVFWLTITTKTGPGLQHYPWVTAPGSQQWVENEVLGGLKAG